MKKIFFLIVTILIALSFNSNIKAISREKFEEAFKEVAYAYYARGEYLQYNINKTSGVYSTFSPEESTSQNINYLVCSVYPYNVYHELLGIYIPQYTADHIAYARDNKRIDGTIINPNVVLYGTGDANNKKITLYFNGDTSATHVISGADETYDVFSAIKDKIRIGDILTYTGHNLLIYELERDENGEITDAFVINSDYGAVDANSKSYASGKINTRTFFNSNRYLYYGKYFPKTNDIPSSTKQSRVNGDYAIFNPVTQGTLRMFRLSTDSRFGSNATKIMNEYAILRFVDDNAQLNYSEESKNNTTPKEIYLSQSVEDRVKYKRLYIEKTVDAHNDDVVSPDEILTYKVVIKNNSNQNYIDSIIVTENISEYVEYIDYKVSKNVIFSKDNNILKFNIGILNAGDKVEITYKVKVKEGHKGKIIESTGMVGSIPSSIIRNTIGNKLTEDEQNDIKTKYNELKNKYSGKELINEIYKQALNIDYKFDKFDITNLVNDSNFTSHSAITLSLNKDNDMYDMVLNKYYSALSYPDGKYEIKYFGALSDKYDQPILSRRQDTIYPENFITGDILIYKNTNDSTTKENGEYAYIYIEGEGFVGKNGNGDTERNSFTHDYYRENGLNMYVASGLQDDSEYEIVLDSLSESGFTREFINFQTLFGKDTYVILRPSLKINLSDKPSTIDEQKYQSENSNPEISPKTSDPFRISYVVVAILSIGITILFSVYIVKRKIN